MERSVDGAGRKRDGMRDDGARVGFLGGENLLTVLASNGHADVAYRILLQTDYPGWGYMISRGATTI
jgi:Bacterial alpha-L-rhamnosidase 6 hairpin glycosidase domain